MSSAHRLRTLAPVGCAITALLSLSSCALPPKQAWQKIRHDGLFAYISYEMRTPRRPLDAPGPVKPIGPASKPIINTPSQPRPLMAQSPTAPVNPQKPATTRTEQRDLGNVPMSPPEGTLTAHAVPGLPGYVRSPYTNPPRLIDVKRSAAGSTMICPYTNKPFIVPAGAGIDAKAAPEAVLTENTRPAPVVTPEPPTVRPKNSNKPGPGNPAKTEDAKPTPPQLKDIAGPASGPSSNSVSASNQATGNNSGPNTGANKGPATNATAGGPASPSATTGPAPSPAPAPEIPYGSPIQGRPGYVNSPYAAAHQLVDVTGLPVGMEVKCPYTGKLFRVPPQDMASSKPAPENR